jgi:hypothetical protein
MFSRDDGEAAGGRDKNIRLYRLRKSMVHFRHGVNLPSPPGSANRIGSLVTQTCADNARNALRLNLPHAIACRTTATLLAIIASVRLIALASDHGSQRGLSNFDRESLTLIAGNVSFTSSYLVQNDACRSFPRSLSFYSSNQNSRVPQSGISLSSYFGTRATKYAFI